MTLSATKTAYDHTCMSFKQKEYMECTNLSNTKSHLKILGVRMVRSQSYTEDPQILGATMPNLAIWVIWCVELGDSFILLSTDSMYTI